MLPVPFSHPGAEFTQSLEVTFYPGEETVHVTQTAEGLGPDNYLSLKTHIQGQVPFLPENITVHIAPYEELYHYSSSGKSPCSAPGPVSRVPSLRAPLGAAQNAPSPLRFPTSESHQC